MSVFAPLEEADPRRVGRFRIVARLGAGGMGRVYLGRSPGGRSVAVKVVRAELAEEAGFRRRFAREVETARRVTGFFTAAVVDADPQGSPAWLATEYVPGMPLGEAVGQHGPWPEKSVLVLGAGLAEALEAVHDAGVVHRDLKPSNVLLAADGPRVIDFGISVLAEVSAHASVLTQTGAVIGTPGFMSPEQLAGGEVGPPSDVFSLGTVLAFTATGSGPFGAGAAQALNYRIVHEQPDLSGLSPVLADVVGRCLAKEPERRPSVATLVRELGRALPDEGQEASRPLSEGGWLPEPVTRVLRERAHTRTVAPQKHGQAHGQAQEQAREQGQGEGKGQERRQGTPPLLPDGDEPAPHHAPTRTGPQSPPAVPPAPVHPPTALVPPAREVRPERPRIPVTPKPADMRPSPSPSPSSTVPYPPVVTRRRVLGTLGGVAAVGAGFTLMKVRSDRADAAERPPAGVKRRWALADFATSSPVAVVGSTLYVGRSDGLRALGTADGRQRWTFDARTDSTGHPPAVADGTVYFGSSDGTMYAIDAATGGKRWSSPVAAESRVGMSATVADGIVYFLSRRRTGAEHIEARLHAVDEATGRERWAFTYSADFAHVPPPLVSGGAVFVGGRDGTLYAVDAATGQERWAVPTAGKSVPEPQKRLHLAPLVPDGTVYAGGGDGTLYAVDATTGKRRWTFTTGERATVRPAVSGGTVCLNSYAGKLYAIDAATGKQRWTLTLGDHAFSAPTVAAGTVYVGSRNHKLYAVDAATGRKLWAYRSEGPISETPVVADGTLYISSGSPGNELQAVALGAPSPGPAG
ncbi:PQQ-binding-like beta-propeller repeat protein [Streptomyces sp. NPDC057363]|uniref:outer membrane protein assembly factor BamB family protein n=1 Tax=Streptomyces sp. NPDC057363 TaxID=3346107 RepID=UPI00363BF02B